MGFVFTLGVGFGLVAAGISTLSYSAGVSASQGMKGLVGNMGAVSAWSIGVRGLAEELQDSTPFTEATLQARVAGMGLPPGSIVKDEGAKISIREHPYLMTNALIRHQIPLDPADAVAKFAEVIGLSLMKMNSGLPCPVYLREPRIPFESIGDLLSFWELPASVLPDLEAAFTIHRTGGINVNTASTRVFRSVWDWQLAAVISMTLNGGRARNPVAYNVVPWMKGGPKTVPQAVGGRPYRASEVVQPLGLMYRPPNLFRPIYPQVGSSPATTLAADIPDAYAGPMWGYVSVQGPGPYRVTSDVFTVSNDRWTMTARVFSNAPPRLLGWEMKE